jgi:tripartite ATP-independent transporter DctM subunit
MNIEIITVAMFASMMALLITGRQIFLVIGAVGITSALILWGRGGIDLAFYATTAFLDWYVLLAIPMFVFMGLVLSRSGVADELFDTIYKWAGGLKGGLGMGTIGITSLLAAMVGEATSATITTGVIAVPSMLKRKYDKRMVTGLVQAGGALGFLIPPSVVFILYGVIARVSVGQLWMAGAIPGLMLAGMYVAYIGIRCARNPKMGPPIPPEQRASMREKIRSLRYGIGPVVLIFIILGFFFMGVTTLMECAAVAAVGAIVLAAIHRRLSWRLIQESADETLKVSTMFLWIVVAALLFSAVYDGLGAKEMMGNILVRFGGGTPYGVIAIMMLSWIGLGTVMDDTAMLLIVAPLYIPVVANMGFSLVWFGVLYVITCEMAYITPPFGYNLFVMKGIVPKDSGITMVDIYRSVIPFVGIQAICLGLLMAFPQISLWLPNLVFGR